MLWKLVLECFDSSKIVACLFPFIGVQTVWRAGGGTITGPGEWKSRNGVQGWSPGRGPGTKSHRSWEVFEI